MKTLKKILIALSIAATLGSVSTSAFAEADAGRIVYSPKDAIDLVVGKLNTAKSAVEGGLTGDEAAAIVKDAKDASKEINANDKVDIARTKANRLIQTAQDLAKDGKKDEAIQKLDEAIAAFEKLKGLI